MFLEGKASLMGKTLLFIQRNWFKIALATLLLYLSFKKDIRLQMNLQGPSEPASEIPVNTGSFREKFTNLVFGGRQVRTPLPGAEQLEIKPFGKEPDFSAFNALAEIPPPMREVFIQRFARVAKEENAKFGIPASLVLGNALLLSKAGESMQVKLALNFFGMLCTDDWKGEKGEIEGKCFRYYETAWMSFRDHSLYITTGKFSGMRGLKGAPNSEWAQTLEKAGFRPVPNYSGQVLRVIQEYQLEKWDKP